MSNTNLGERHKQCIEALKVLGPSTAKEVAKYLYDKKYTNLFERNIAHPRLKELADSGKVKVIGKKFDVQTKRNVNLYDLN